MTDPVKVPMKGATLALGVTSILGVKTIDDLVGGEMAMIDVTSIADTAVQSIAGIINWNDFTFKYMHDPSDTGHAAITTAFAAGSSVTFNVVLSNVAASTLALTGPIKSHKKKGGGVGDVYMAEVSQKINSVVEVA